MTIQRQPSLRRLDWHYMAMQIGFWAMFASIVGYQTALLLDRGFSNGEAGLMTSVRCLAGIVCQPLLGGFADRHPEFPLKRIVSLSMLLCFNSTGSAWRIDKAKNWTMKFFSLPHQTKCLSIALWRTHAKIFIFLLRNDSDRQTIKKANSCRNSFIICHHSITMKFIKLIN